MVQKGILAIIVSLLTISIVIDTYKINETNREFQLKLNYLETLNSKGEFQSYYDNIRSGFTRRSLWKNYFRFLELNPNKISMDTPVDIEKYIDVEDREQFNKQLGKIPVPKTLDNKNLLRIRNKMIFDELLQYAQAKLGVGASMLCCGSYRLVKDVFGNLTLSDTCGFVGLDIFVNGIRIDENSPYPFVIPKSNSLLIEIEEPNYNKWSNQNSGCYTSIIDLKKLIN